MRNDEAGWLAQTTRPHHTDSQTDSRIVDDDLDTRLNELGWRIRESKHHEAKRRHYRKRRR
jgi:hypothetical protein